MGGGLVISKCRQAELYATYFHAGCVTNPMWRHVGVNVFVPLCVQKIGKILFRLSGFQMFTGILRAQPDVHFGGMLRMQTCFTCLSCCSGAHTFSFYRLVIHCSVWCDLFVSDICHIFSKFAHDSDVAIFVSRTVMFQRCSCL